MRISDYMLYGLLLSGFGGGGISLALSSEPGNDAAPWVMAGGIALSSVGGIILAIGVIAKGVQVGNRWGVDR